MAKLSVIVPVYNSENRGLNECIESIVGQSYKDFELLLINDGSTDNSLQICEIWQKKDNRIKIINKDNNGVSAARNIGLDIACGDYVTFIDSDDWIEKDYLNELMSYSKDNGLVICGIRQKFADASEKIFSAEVGQYLISDAPAFHALIRSRLVFGPCNKLFRLSLINDNNIRFPVNIDYGEDRLFCYEYLSHIQRYEIIDTVHYDYLMRKGDSLSAKYRENQFFLEYDQWCSLLELYKHHSCLTEDSQRDLSIELYWMVNDAIYKLYARNNLDVERIASIVNVPLLDLVKKYAGQIQDNKVLKKLIMNRNAHGISIFYHFLKLCKK